MAFKGNALCTTYKRDVLEGKHAHSTHTFKLALYTEDADLSADTEDYTATNEITATGYSAGGVTLTALAADKSGTTGFASFQDVTIASADITARGALIYNTTFDGGVDTTEAVMVLDFGRNRTSSSGQFVVRFPTADAINAILRIQ